MSGMGRVQGRAEVLGMFEVEPRRTEHHNLRDHTVPDIHPTVGDEPQP